MPHSFSSILLSWYDQNARDLPWRGFHDSYRTWISEIMLQQTRVDTVIPYYHRFLSLFPTLDALAAAPEEQVLKAWEGLGYPVPAPGRLPWAPSLPAAIQRPQGLVDKAHEGGRAPQCPGADLSTQERAHSGLSAA